MSNLEELFKNSTATTPTPNLAWRRLSDEERLTRVKDALITAGQSGIKVVEANEDGQIIVRLTQPMPARQRGTVLLDLEAFLKKAIDHGVVLWLEPMGDRNSLRNLRGIEVKS